MTGSLQIKKDKFYVVLSYKDINGKFKTKWISTGLETKNNKRKAEQMIPTMILDYSFLENETNEAQNKYLVDFMKNWLQNKKNKVELSTWESYYTYVEKHLVPYFEKFNLKLTEVTPKYIVDYYDYKFKGGRCDSKQCGLSIASIKKHSMIIKEVLNEAVIMELISRNPAEHIPLPKKEDEQDEKCVFLNAEEANKLIEAFKGHQLQPLVYVTLYYGLRRSELLGLKWNAIDLENDTIKIQHTIVKNRTIVAKDKTKSKSSKSTFALLPEVKDILLKLKSEQEQNKALFGNTYNTNDYVFKKQDGSLYRPDSVTRGFQRVLKNNGLTKMRFHDLRHSTASILYDKGWDIKDISEWLRHSDIETTSNIYTHISKSRKQLLAKNLENTFSL